MSPKLGKRTSRSDEVSSNDHDTKSTTQRSKRVKTEKTSAKTQIASPHPEETQTSRFAPQTDSNGDSFWEISRQRRVTISTFKGRTLVNIREYYEKGGQELPGKKGISMTLEQFNTLVTLLPDIETVIRGKGSAVTRPDYSGAPETENKSSKAPSEAPADSSPTKNFEATSDEDNGE